jgi:tetratricopeptide (TPR) repeat protein
MGNPFEGMSLLKYVLEQLPRTELRKIPVAGMDVEELGYIGGAWVREGRAADAEALLEHLFEDVARLDGRAELAFDSLADCYDELGRPRKKERLVAQVGAARDPTLRSAALHRRITIIADRGERKEAWRLFAEAQRYQPDNPMLATLEMTMLLGERNYARMKKRGQFWIARLSRDRDHDYRELIAHLRALVADPAAAALNLESRGRPEVVALRRQIDTLPAVECHYALDRVDEEACLVPAAQLASVEASWHEVVDVRKPNLTMATAADPGAWERVAPGIDWLARHPLAWQSFDVLDDLALAVQDAGIMTADVMLLAPLAERAHALLRLAVQRSDAAGCALPWGFAENRPALRLVVLLYFVQRDAGRTAEARDIARWLVLELNPHDNHGLRVELSRLCLELGDPEGALDVCARFPDDALVGTQFNRALALFMLGRHGEAEAALRGAGQHAPKALAMLLADDPKPAPMRGSTIAFGGREEAWEYREAHWALWEGNGALIWARGLKLPRTRR